MVAPHLSVKNVGQCSGLGVEGNFFAPASTVFALDGIVRGSWFRSEAADESAALAGIVAQGCLFCLGCKRLSHLSPVLSGLALDFLRHLLEVLGQHEWWLLHFLDPPQQGLLDLDLLDEGIRVAILGGGLPAALRLLDEMLGQGPDHVVLGGLNAVWVRQSPWRVSLPFSEPRSKLGTCLQGGLRRL